MKFAITLFLVVLLSLPAPSAAQSPEAWRSVRTNNLFVIGNADPEKLRQVAVWLEFFHSAFARLVSHNVLDSSSPTTVVVFRDDASFTPFKPLYQGRPANVAGYFQPGDDVNYIAMSLDPRERDPYSIAFHEYVHLHLRDNVPGVPVWLNEGLAEFYGSLQFSNGEAVLGVPLPYIRLLRTEELLPLTNLLAIDTSSPHYNEQDKSGIFYGESWALVHYLMLGGPGRQDQFKQFLYAVSRGDDVAKALENSFGMTLDLLEKELRAYVRRAELPTLRIASGDDPQVYASYTAMQRQSLTEGEANFYLGDLLLHIGRDEDAERYFKQAIALEPGLTRAYAALGQISVRHKQYPEAKKYLERAATTQQSYLVHYQYAWVLSREGLSPTGRISEYSPANAAVMREQLWRAIKLKPDFAPAYYLLALVDFVTDQRLDETLELAQKARSLQPGKASYTLLLAQIHARNSDATAARVLLEPLTRDSDANIRNEAQNLLDSLNNLNASSNRSGATTRTTSNISGALAAEPVQPAITRVLGGDPTGSTAIRDGQTIQNSASVPSVDELVSRYVQAMGGAKAIKAVTSRVIKGTLDVAGVSRGGSFETYAQAPDKSLTVLQAHPFGTIKVGFNGRTGWSQTSLGTRPIKNPAELGLLQRDSDFYAPLRLKEDYAKITAPGMSQIGYRDVYVLDLQPAVGAVERMYLDAKTYLPVRMNTVRRNGNVAEPVEIYLDDWQAVDGIQFPFSISQRFPKLTLSFTVKEIRHNVALDASLFEPQVKLP
ncbi:MAG TPA: tetratricopeptide repeat protein [Pyrinomonadaceae bacterium]|jgi:tetratricopeptide (TPR) repeat protein